MAVNKKQRKIGIAVAVVLVVLLLLPFLINVNSFRPGIESGLSNVLGRKVEIGDLSLSILRRSVSAASISIGDDPAFSKSPFVTAKGLKIGIKLLPLIFSKRLSLTGITLDEPSIVLLNGPNGKWNFSSLGGSAPTTEPKSGDGLPGNISVAELNVTDGKLQVGKVNSTAKPLIIEEVNIVVTDLSSTTQFPFELTMALPGSGKLKLEGKAGPITPGGTPLKADLKIQNLDLALLGTDPSMGLGGSANLGGTLASDGKSAKLNGTLSLEKIKLSPKGKPAGRAIEVKLASDYDLKKQTGTLSQGDISVGKAVARLTGRCWAQGETTAVDVKLNGPGLPVDELSSLLPALGVLPAGSGLKGGTLSVVLGFTGSTDKLVIAGPVKLENTSLTGFDLGSKLSALSAFTGKAAASKDTTIQVAGVDTRIAPEGTRLDSINVLVPALASLSGGGTISPEGALNIKMVANLTGGAGSGVTQKAGLGGGKSGNGIPFVISGTTANPKFLPDVKGMVGSSAQQAIGEKVNPKGDSSTKGLGGLFKKK
jgi:AsmA protein